MHSRYLVQLAAIVASQHSSLARLRAPVAYWGGDEFWALSRARANEWAARFKAIRGLREEPGELDSRAFWNELEPLLEEVFLAEVCTRVWCATLAGIDHACLPGELDPIARSVYVANLEVRRQALRLLLFSRGLPGVPTTALNRLRFNCEVWTDQLLARAVPTSTAVQFCFERRRVRHLAQDMSKFGSRRAAEVWSQGLVGMHYLLATRAMRPPSCGSLNSDLGSLIASCLPSGAFDGCGVARPGWSVDAYQSDGVSFSLLAELCGGMEADPLVRRSQ